MRNDIFHSRAHIFQDTVSNAELFDDFGELNGGADKITPELSTALGRAVADTDTRISVGYSDCPLCRILSAAFISGASASGAKVTDFGATFFAESVQLSKSYLFNLLVFFENDGHRLRIRLSDKFGLPPEKERIASIEKRLSEGNFRFVGISDISLPKSISDSSEIFVSSLTKNEALSGFPVAVSGNNAATKALRCVLSACGGKILKPSRGICELSISSDGLRLFVRGEKEHWYDDAHVRAACTLLFFRSGGKKLSIPSDSPGILEEIAAENGGQILRLGRDACARETFLSQEILCNGISDAVFLLTQLARSEMSVDEIFSSLPDFTLISRKVSLKGDKNKLLSYIEASCNDMYSEHTSGLRICTDGGWVNLCPTRSRTSLRITAEGRNEEIASELCNLFVERAGNMDIFCDK